MHIAGHIGLFYQCNTGKNVLQVPDSIPPGLPDPLHRRLHPFHLHLQHLHQDLLHHLHLDKYLPCLCQVCRHYLLRSGHVQVANGWKLKATWNLFPLRIEFLILGAAVLAILVNHDLNVQEVKSLSFHHHHPYHHNQVDLCRCCGPFQFTLNQSPSSRSSTYPARL